ncbi:myb-like protein A [Chironomus tepperi]|uniref:myb-like protein A n=1 Tax=Chironomus tepperi TaxID=113505 RepID=UPI00391F3567
METNDKESDNEILETPSKTIFTDDYDDDYESIHLNFPAISPVSNISTSSGFISCGSSSSSKPTTPTNLLTDKHCDDYDECIPNSTTTTHDNINNNNKPSAINNDEIIRDNENGQLAININNNHQRRNYDIDTESDDKSNKYLSSPVPSCSKGVKSRSKYRNNSSSSSSSDHHSQPSSSSSRYRQSKRNISLDDEIVIYESDSSLIESRRRITNNSHFSNCNRINFQIQGHSSANAAIISRHKSEENPPTQPSNQIVSILKRKDSSGKESPSLVTFSPNVKDNFESNRASTSSSSSSHRQGILKKRSSLDESSRRFRSHSPSSESEKGCLVKDDRRRNSCEEIHHQGILKQKSYESSTGYSSSGTRSSGLTTPNSGVQGILKKPSLTPSDHSSDHSTTKHVSISEAVILAAAELCKDMIIDDTHEPYIKPILKLDNDHHYGHERKPKPILKKNHSSENEEIRSILKSRKSSREEPDDL